MFYGGARGRAYDIEPGTGLPPNYKKSSRRLDCDDVYFVEKKGGRTSYWYPESCHVGSSLISDGKVVSEDLQGVRSIESAKRIIKRINEIRQMRFYMYLLRLTKSIDKKYSDGDEAVKTRIGKQFAKIKVNLPNELTGLGSVTEVNLFVPKNMKEIPDEFKQLDLRMLLVDPLAAEELKEIDATMSGAAVEPRRGTNLIGFLTSNDRTDRRLREQLREILVRYQRPLFENDDANWLLYSSTGAGVRKSLGIDDAYSGKNFFGYKDTNQARAAPSTSTSNFPWTDTNVDATTGRRIFSDDDIARLKRLLAFAASRIYADQYYRTAKRALQLSMSKGSEADRKASCAVPRVVLGADGLRYDGGMPDLDTLGLEPATGSALGDSAFGVSPARLSRRIGYVDGLKDGGMCVPWDLDRADITKDDPMLVWWRGFARIMRPRLTKTIEQKSAMYGLGTSAKSESIKLADEAVRKATSARAPYVAKTLKMLSRELMI